MNGLALTPITLREAKAFVGRHHRHNTAPRGWLFGVALRELSGGDVVGVGVCGRPVNRHLDDGQTVEITRVCTTGTRNACSMIYGALFRAAVALGYCRAVTYTLATEPGSSVKAAGFVEAERLAPRETWNCPGRRRITRNLFGATERPTEAKIRWEKVVPC